MGSWTNNRNTHLRTTRMRRKSCSVAYLRSRQAGIDLICQVRTGRSVFAWEMTRDWQGQGLACIPGVQCLEAVGAGESTSWATRKRMSRGSPVVKKLANHVGAVSVKAGAVGGSVGWVHPTYTVHNIPCTHMCDALCTVPTEAMWHAVISSQGATAVRCALCAASCRAHVGQRRRAAGERRGPWMPVPRHVRST